jgi:hypothetical protein
VKGRRLVRVKKKQVEGKDPRWRVFQDLLKVRQILETPSTKA